MKNLAAISDNKDLVTKEYADDIVAVQNLQPTTASNRIWVEETATGIQVPTYEEFAEIQSTIHNTIAEDGDGLFIRSPNGTLYKICVNNSGELSASIVS